MRKRVKLIIVFLTLLAFVLFIVYGLTGDRNKYKDKIAQLLSDNKIIPLEADPKMLDRTISDFFISTSHNTYIKSAQHLSVVSIAPIRDALKMGARCIELDISSLLPYPIVAHGDKTAITTTFITFKRALEAILQYGFNTSDPLILCLEIYDTSNTNINEQIKELLVETFKDRLWDRTKSGSFVFAPIRQLLNKIVVVGPTGEDGVFDNIFDNRITNLGANRAIKTRSSGFSRVYRDDNSIDQILSSNLDPKPYWANRHNLVAMNFQLNDYSLYEYLYFFKNSSFVKIDRG